MPRYYSTCDPVGHGSWYEGSEITHDVFRSSIHVTTYSRRTGELAPAPAHITSSHIHGLTEEEYVAHVHVNNYKDSRRTDWTLLTRRDVTWGRAGQGPNYPGWQYGVSV